MKKKNRFAVRSFCFHEILDFEDNLFRDFYLFLSFFSSFPRATLMDSKTVDQLVIWQAGRQQVFNRRPDIIHPTTRLWQLMGKLSQLIYQKLPLEYLKTGFEKNLHSTKTLD